MSLTCSEEEVYRGDCPELVGWLQCTPKYGLERTTSRTFSICSLSGPVVKQVEKDKGLLGVCGSRSVGRR